MKKTNAGSEITGDFPMQSYGKMNEWKWITLKQAVKQAGTSHFVAIVHNLISVEKLIYKWERHSEHPISVKVKSPKGNLEKSNRENRVYSMFYTVELVTFCANALRLIGILKNIAINYIIVHLFDRHSECF